MSRLKKLISNIKKFQENWDSIILDIIYDREADVVRYVYEIQLYMEGIRGEDGAFIMDYDPYKPSTIAIKERKGQPTDRVTLRDTGAFHKSFYIEYGDNEFTITAEDWKTPLLMERYGGGIMNLTDEHLNSLKVGILKPELIKQLKTILP